MTRARFFSVLSLVVMSLVLLIASGGCEAIVNGNVQSFKCDDGVDAGICPSGQRCVAGSCVDCIDGNCAVNDCEKIDKDHDGYALCGHQNDAGTFVGADCDDNDPDVHPGAPQKCNGKDNDCDGHVDNPCPIGSQCAPASQSCVAGGCTPGSCPQGQVCDDGTKQCHTPAATPLGSECTADIECENGAFCGNYKSLPDEIIKNHTPNAICTKPCCTSNDCPSGFACFGAGTGGNYCISAKDLQRGAMGGTAGGASCVNDSDCRSGVCVNKVCQDTCCGSTQCSGGTTCRAMDLRGVGTATKFVLGCGAPPSGGAKEGGGCEVCSCGGGTPSCGLLCLGGDYPACTEGVCDSNGDTCHPACCGSGACTSSHSCRNEVARAQQNIFVTTCSPDSLTPGPNGLGDTCKTDTDCAGNICIKDATGNYCSDACCTDNDCASSNGHPTGLLCRPYDSGQSHYFLRCVKPPMAGITGSTSP